MLHLYARREIILAGRYRRLVTDRVPPAECRQRSIRQLRSTRQQFFMDSHEIPLALLEKFQDLLAVRFGFLRPLQLRYSGGVRP